MSDSEKPKQNQRLILNQLKNVITKCQMFTRYTHNFMRYFFTTVSWGLIPDAKYMHIQIHQIKTKKKILNSQKSSTLCNKNVLRTKERVSNIENTFRPFGIIKLVTNARVPSSAARSCQIQEWIGSFLLIAPPP